jgi:hypothetical protein
VNMKDKKSTTDVTVGQTETDKRTDIRALDRHFGRREVYFLLDAVAGQSHAATEVRR